AIKTAYDKIRTYHADTWVDMYAISVILDPRLKADYYEENGWTPGMITHAKSVLLRSAEAYGMAVPQFDQVDIADSSEHESDWKFRGLKRRRLEKENEVERYLAEAVADSGVDVLEWWKHHSDEYPCLARIARDYLAIPATNAPAERVFSGE